MASGKHTAPGLAGPPSASLSEEQLEHRQKLQSLKVNDLRGSRFLERVWSPTLPLLLPGKGGGVGPSSALLTALLPKEAFSGLHDFTL